MRVAAVDMGATSVRVAVIDLDAETPEIEVVHRWFHGPDIRPDGSVRWRWSELVDNVRRGLARARDSGPLASIGVDGWAVDYGLLDEEGALLSDPHSYRSPRTEGWRRVAESLGVAQLYRRTGIQLMPINTIFQLAAHDPAELARARRLVMLPELVAYELTGAGCRRAFQRRHHGPARRRDRCLGHRSRGIDRRRPARSCRRPSAPAACSASTTAPPSTWWPRTTRPARSRRAHWPRRAAPSSPPARGSWSASSVLCPTSPRRRDVPTSPTSAALSAVSAS